jgi:hypothetical protein
VEECTYFTCVEGLEASRSVQSIFWNGMVPHVSGIFLFLEPSPSCRTKHMKNGTELLASTNS